MDRNQTRQQIEKILSSESLADKSQLRTLLEILFQNLDSQTTLKPDRVIKELWPEEAKTKRSADLATEKNRLRRALKSYYDAEGKADPIIISLPNHSLPGPDGMKERRWIVAEPRHSAPSPPSLSPPAVKRRSTIEIAVIAVAAVAIASLAFLSIRMLLAVDPPQLGRLDGSTLTIMNAEGRELWHKSFPDGFWREYYDQGLEQRLWFGDLDGSGHNDVLFLYHPAGNPKAHSTTLICYSDRGKEKWRWVPGRALPELKGSPTVFVTIGFGVLKTDKAGQRRIVVSSRNEPFYPQQIAIVDSAGKTQSEYWHSGVLAHFALADLDGSGKEKIIATGISNGYRQATMIVLDPDRVFGASTEAARPELQIHGMGVAQEEFRFLFPRSDLNEAMSVYNAGQEFTIDQGRLRLIVRECSINPSCVILYEFDAKFHLRAVTPDDQFRSVHKEFYLRSKADHPFSAEEESKFWKVRCLAGCDGDFVPVVGR